MSTSITNMLLLLVFFCIGTSSGLEDYPDRSLDFVKTQFEFLEKFIKYKDADAISKFLSPWFYLKFCNNEEFKKEQFIKSVLNMDSTAPFHVEVLKSDNDSKQCGRISSICLELKVHGFGKPFIVDGWYGRPDRTIVPTWEGGRAINCDSKN